MDRRLTQLSLFLALTAGSASGQAPGVSFDARTAQSGKWSDAATWSNRRAPKAGDRVQVRPGHFVVYDVESDATLRMVHVGGDVVEAGNQFLSQTDEKIVI